MSQNTPSPMRSHGVTMGVVLLALWWADTRGAFRSAHYRTEAPTTDGRLRNHYANYLDEPWLASMLATTLAAGRSVVLFGSSELTTPDHPAKPVVFFNDGLGQPLIAVGHAGDQSFSIHAQLIAADTLLEQARLVILLSPGWFIGDAAVDGTALSAFLEYQPAPSLYRVRRRLQRGDHEADAVCAYLAEHAHELGSMQPIAVDLARRASFTARSGYAFSRPYYDAVLDHTAQWMLRVPHMPPDQHQPKDTAPPDWKALYAAAAEEHRAACTNNPFLVNDAYYAQHVQGRTREVRTIPLAENREYRDLQALLDFLVRAQARPLFVMQPLNPYVYTNLKDLDPTIDSITNSISAHGFRCLNLWTSDTTTFAPGLLTDVMHLGPRGWYQVDSAILAHFQ
jgi:D-alanine transfer protein